MGENTLAIRITADTVDFNTKFGVASANAKSLTKDFADLAKQAAQGLLDPAGLAQLEQASRAMLEAKAAAAELKEQLRGTREESFNLGEGFEAVRGQLSKAFEVTGIAVAVEGFRELTETINELGERAVQLRSVSDVLGLTVQEVQALQAAGEEAGVGANVLTVAGEKLSVTLNEARNGAGAAVEKLKALGVTTEDIADPNFKLINLFQLLHERLESGNTEQQTRNALLQEFGAKTGLAVAALKEFDGTAEGVERVMARINGLTEGNTRAAAAASAATHEWMTSFENTVTKLLFGEQQATYSTHELIQSLNELSNKAQSMSQLQVNVALGQKQEVDPNIAAEARAQARLKEANEEIASIQLVTLEDLQSDKDRIASTKQGTAERLAALKEFAQDAAVFYGPNVDKVREANRQVIAEQRAVADEAKRLADEQGRSMSEMFVRIANGARQSMSQAWKEITGSAAESAKTVETAQVGAIDRQITEVQRLGQLHQISAKAELDQTIALLNQKWAAEQEYFNKLRALYANQPVEAAKADQLEQAAHNAYLTQLERADATAAAQIQKQWQTLTNAVQQGFATAFRGMITQGESFGTAMKNMFLQVADAGLQNAAKNIASMAMEAAGVKGIKSQQIREDAGAGAAAAYKAIVGIPYVGPFLAPAAAAVAYAGIMAFDSAEGGYDIPAGMNPVVQTHAREMILPRPYADVIRGLADNGGGAANGGAGTHIHAHFTVQALDSRDAAAYFERNGDTIADALATQMRRFHPALSGR